MPVNRNHSNKLLKSHKFSKQREKWYFVSKIVLTYSEKKIVLVTDYGLQIWRAQNNFGLIGRTEISSGAHGK